MTRRWIAMGVWLAGLSSAWGLETPRGCFRSVAEAAAVTHAIDAESGEQQGTSFRLEDLRRDRMLNVRWAMVRSCDHPERPLVAVELGPDREIADTAVKESAAAVLVAPVVRAGARVRVVGRDRNLRFETSGVAQSNGALGQAIGVRLNGSAVSADGGAAPVLTGIVRSADVLEWEP